MSWRVVWFSHAGERRSIDYRDETSAHSKARSVAEDHYHLVSVEFVPPSRKRRGPEVGRNRSGLPMPSAADGPVASWRAK